MDDAGPESPPHRASRLDGARSAYLAGARDQPIDWHPWGRAPFDLARRTSRPILLDIGAVWCHWCHVMDEGTYADAEVARLLAQHFVAIKVDRDEHPEVDRRYQRQVSVLTGEGGWPLTAFLTPDGDVFLGGTYFPPQDGHGRPGFRRLLREVARIFRDEPERIRENTQQIQAALQRAAERPSLAVESEEFLRTVTAQLDQTYDPVHGGFGFAPKFPHPTAVELLLWRGWAWGDAASEARALETLARMADGGLYDQVGGGFHRYSVDEGWHVPHFEKLGTDNAALLAAYAAGACVAPDPGRFTATIRGVVEWARATLGDPAGGFGASQDADNAPGDDGGYYTWSRVQLKELFDADELRFVVRVFGVGSDGRMPHNPDQNVLYRLMPPLEAAERGTAVEAERRLAAASQILAKARGARPPPLVDRALYADINGGFVRGLVAAARLLGDPEYLGVARRAADRFLADAFTPERGVAHQLDGRTGRGFGHLEDQVAFASGLIELAGATAEPRYAGAAESLVALIAAEFPDDGGMLRDLAPKLYDGPEIGGIAEPRYPLEDTPHLAANAGAALTYARFASLTGRGEWQERAERLAGALHGRLLGAGLFAAGTALATGVAATPAARVIVTGTGPAADALARAAEASFHPNLWVFRGRPPAPFSLPDELDRASAPEPEARAFLCFGTRCLAPVTDPAAIPGLLRREGRPGAG